MHFFPVLAAAAARPLSLQRQEVVYPRRRRKSKPNRKRRPAADRVDNPMTSCNYRASFSPQEEVPMLRHAADRRTLGYLAVTALLSVANWKLGRVHPVLYPVTLFMFFTTAVISHNHNHLGVWRSKWLNLLTSYVIALFYGHPAVAWVPTHNQVHHKLNNKPGDSSRSPKWFAGNHLAALLVYPTLTNFAQTKDINGFLKDLWKRDRPAFLAAASEYVVFFGSMAALFLIDWRKALLFFVIPPQVALIAIQRVNLLQHIETDADS